MSEVSFGEVAEAKAIAYLTERGYHVFTQLSGKAPFDLVVFKNSQLSRISVKGASGPSVELRRIRANRHTNHIHLFDPSSCDFVAIYVKWLDNILLVPSSDIKVTGIWRLTQERITKYLEKRIGEHSGLENRAA